jgi:hypothetical protein
VLLVWPLLDCAVPARQLVHCDAETRLLEADHVPAGHGTHAEAPASEYVPAPHCTHMVETEAPGVLEKVPAAQLRHVEALCAPTVVE